MPDSILARSRISLMSASRSVPAWLTVCAYCTCFSVKLPSWLSASWRERISKLFNGVRSSCDMLARNCDL